MVQAVLIKSVVRSFIRVPVVRLSGRLAKSPLGPKGPSVAAKDCSPLQELEGAKFLIIP